MSEFGDDTPEDVVTEGDEDVDWSQVKDVDSQVESINQIKDDDERLEMAKEWSKALEGDD